MCRVIDIVFGMFIIVFIITCFIVGCGRSSENGEDIKIKMYHNIELNGHDYICIRTYQNKYGTSFGGVVHNPECKLCMRRKQNKNGDKHE